MAQIKIDSSFDSDDKTSILQKLNSISERELSELASCSKTMAKQLIQYRRDNLEVKDLLELVQLPGFSATTLSSVASDILKRNLQSESANKLYVMNMTQIVPKYVSSMVCTSRSNTFSLQNSAVALHPDLLLRISLLLLQLPDTVLAFDLQQQGLSWVLMSEDLSVLHWDFLPIPEKFFLTYNHVTYMQIVCTLLSVV